MNILIPIGGWDRYFREEDYAFPKPLIEISGRPMIEHTLRAFLQLRGDVHFTFVVRDQDCRRFSLDNVLRILVENHKASIITLNSPTQGAVCSCLMAIDNLDPDEELLIANSDQAIDATLQDMIIHARDQNLDATVLTFDSTHPQFSYIRTDVSGLIVETSEKRVISRDAIAGVYYFRCAKDFIQGAMDVLNNATPVQGAYYTSQVLNELILDGKRISCWPVSSSVYHPLYTPQKVAEYEDIIRRQNRHQPAANKPTLLIPMAGEGQRFVAAGYEKPKPLIDVHGRPMIARVLDNLHHQAFRTLAVVRQAHLEQSPDLHRLLDDYGVTVTPCAALTEGAACTVLLAREHIDPEAPLLLANCDQIVDFDCQTFVQDCLDRQLDGSILVFRDHEKNPKWSFAKTDNSGLVTEVREKVAISDLATVGIYFFAKGRDFIAAAIDMIVRNDRVNGEFYVCPVYNQMIRAGQKIGVYEIPATAMHGIGTPQDLQAYLTRTAEG